MKLGTIGIFPHLLDGFCSAGGAVPHAAVNHVTYAGRGWLRMRLRRSPMSATAGGPAPRIAPSPQHPRQDRHSFAWLPPVRRPVLSARVVRQAFLSEGAGPLAGVFGPYYEADGLVLQGVALLQRPSKSLEDRLLDLAHGQGPVLGDLGRELLCRLHQLLGGDDIVHQADTMGLLGAHAVAHKEDLHRPA